MTYREKVANILDSLNNEDGDNQPSIVEGGINIQLIQICKIMLRDLSSILREMMTHWNRTISKKCKFNSLSTVVPAALHVAPMRMIIRAVSKFKNTKEIEAETKEINIRSPIRARVIPNQDKISHWPIYYK